MGCHAYGFCSQSRVIVLFWKPAVTCIDGPPSYWITFSKNEMLRCLRRRLLLGWQPQWPIPWRLLACHLGYSVLDKQQDRWHAAGTIGGCLLWLRVEDYYSPRSLQQDKESLHIWLEANHSRRGICKLHIYVCESHGSKESLALYPIVAGPTTFKHGGNWDLLKAPLPNWLGLQFLMTSSNIGQLTQ